MVVKRQHYRLPYDLIAEASALWGVSLKYRDATGRMRESPGDAVLEVLAALIAATPAGAQPETGVAEYAGAAGNTGAEDLGWLREAIVTRKAKVRERLVEPVLVAWDGRLRLEIPSGTKATLVLEEPHDERATELGVTEGSGGAEGPDVGAQTLPYGYHRLRLESADRADEAKVISAPKRCWEEGAGAQQWGVFVPTYALRSERDWGAGDLAEIETTLKTVSAAGGDAVSTLPLLASYLERPFEPSPYRPVSKLFWNEFYLAVERVPEWGDCRAARAIWGSGEVQQQIAQLRSQVLVDYAAVMALKRQVLEELCRHFFQTAGDRRRAALDTFVRQRPEVLGYAQFRAKEEEQGCDWRDWSRAARSDRYVPARVEQLSEAARYHVYCQWQLEEQLRGLSRLGVLGGEHAQATKSAGLFLDLPVGVHPGGFDTWSRRDLFVRGVSIGSPPDAFFSHGQSWSSPPLHPLVSRSEGHSYWSEVLSNHMRFARRLRIDHVMSLHRLFWIPEGRAPHEGVYVDYPAEELYAVLCLESERHRTSVTGEDLGTVPPGVRPSMRKHGVSGTWVLQSALRPRAKSVITTVPQHVMAALGTHDMFPLAGFLTGGDIQMRLQTGQLGEDAARRAFAARRRLVARLSSFLAGQSDPPDPAAVLRRVIEYLARSPAEFVLLNLDDLLLQHEPHNVPGTGAESHNWQRKLSTDESRTQRAIEEAGQWLAREHKPR